MKCLVLDAMGVIFESADDVAELLIPFIAEQGGDADEDRVQAAYLQTSLGTISPDESWKLVGLDADLEDDYLSRFKLNPGLLELLALARKNAVPVWCLSNDVGRWSDKLRNRLGIETSLAGSIISGEVGVRKPDREIYQILLESCGCAIEDLLFVDDRDKNVIAARKMGIDSILFEARTGFEYLQNCIAQIPPGSITEDR